MSEPQSFTVKVRMTFTYIQTVAASGMLEAMDRARRDAPTWPPAPEGFEGVPDYDMTVTPEKDRRLR